MTARDPAVEAAQRAWSAEGWGGELELSEGHLAIAAAREALAPIRNLHRPLDRSRLPYSTDNRVVCNHCLGPIDWPCATARLIYPEGELK